MFTSTLKQLALCSSLFAAAAGMTGCDPAAATDDDSAIDGIETASQRSALTTLGTGFGWAYTHQLTGTYTPVAGYSYNSTGGAIQVQSLATGSYRVTMNGLNGLGGNVQVVAYGNDSARCKSAGWSGTTSQVLMNVQCHSVSGAPVNSQFVIQFHSESMSVSGSQAGAYLWTSDASHTHTPPSAYQWNANGGTNQVQYLGRGSYRATIPGHTTGNGTVNVTAYGSDAAHCKVQGWYPNGSATLIDVLCFDTSGALVDSKFTLRYNTRNTFLSGLGPVPTGFVWANDATACPYTPSSFYQFNTGSGVNTSCRYSGYTGFYSTQFPNLPASGAGSWGVPYSSSAMITAYGSNASFCKLSLWGDSGTGAAVTSRCFDATGAAIDSQFTMSFNTNEFPPPG